ncbi:hypothetical protein H6P81_021378 [Aristolochia fimbriata]|uniref:Uncharacterized protein n=1 Tax=Aristolochia fimbriata TaxID=158543 RepID=A0AAV7DR22_ARIFI|nr:hypothetical protein H6P81_021378 [Aristolochia fimbriata]
MPRGRRARPGAKRPSESLAALATGRRRVSAPAPATVRDANTRTTTRARSVPSERGSARRSDLEHVAPEATRVKGTPAWATRPTQPPPPAPSAAPPLAVRAGRRGEQIGRPCPLARLAENTLPQGHFARRVVAPPSPWPPRGSGRVRGPGSEEDPCRQLPPRTGGLARIGTPGQEKKLTRIPLVTGERTEEPSMRIERLSPLNCSSQKPPFCDGPGASPMEWGAREGDSPVVPDPVAPRGAVGEVGLFGNAAQIGRGWGRAMRRSERGRARAGPPPTRAPTDAGHGATQARRMIPPAIRRLCDRGGWRYDHGRVPAAPAPLCAGPAGSPFDPP